MFEIRYTYAIAMTRCHVVKMASECWRARHRLCWCMQNATRLCKFATLQGVADVGDKPLCCLLLLGCVTHLHLHPAAWDQVHVTCLCHMHAHQAWLASVRSNESKQHPAATCHRQERLKDDCAIVAQARMLEFVSHPLSHACDLGGGLLRQVEVHVHVLQGEKR